MQENKNTWFNWIMRQNETAGEETPIIMKTMPSLVFTLQLSKSPNEGINWDQRYSYKWKGKAKTQRNKPGNDTHWQHNDFHLSQQ